MHCSYHFCSSIFVSIAAISLVLILAGSSRAQVTEHKLVPSDGSLLDNFGQSVSLSGDHALVGAWRDSVPESATGSAYVFERQGDGSWLEVAKLTASDGDLADRFGWAVSLSADYALLGAPGDDDMGGGSGSAYVFERQSDGSWPEVAKLTASDGNGGDFFGHSMSLVGDRALVGAYSDNDLGFASGSAYVFERQADGAWLEVAKLTAPDAAAYDWFGLSVSLSGDRALVGATGDDDLGEGSGSAYVFERQSDESWLEVAKLIASDGAEEEFFGRSVSLSGDYALVGASSSWDWDPDVTGSAYVFERQGDGSWLEVTKLTASDGGAEDLFGRSVSLSGDYALVGNMIENERRGAAYMFERQESGDWLELFKVTAFDDRIGDRFGNSVSLSGDCGLGECGLIGAFYDDEFGIDSGSAYILGDEMQTAVEIALDLPRGYLLSAPYPNPFNPRAVVPFEVPESAHVRLTLVDIFGREVAVLLNGQVAAGSHEAVLDGGRLASGVYLVRLEAEGVVHATQKVLLLR